MIIPQSLPAGFITPSDRPTKILFVCLGNICRSPAAEEIFRQIVYAEGANERYMSDSAGTGRYHIGDLPDRRMRVHAIRRGYELTHRCRQVTESDFYEFDLIIGMDMSNISNLREMAPTVESSQKVCGMAAFFGSYDRFDHVPDPYYEGAEGFELVLNMLEDGCRNLYDTLENRRQLSN